MVILISKIDTRKFHGQNRKMTFTSKKNGVYRVQ